MTNNTNASTFLRKALRGNAVFSGISGATFLIASGLVAVMLDAYDHIGKIHLVGANLPYVADSDRDEIAAEVRHDPPSALFAGSDGLAVIRKFVPAVRERIEPGGFLAMEIGREQGSQVAALLVEAGFDKVEVRDDLSGKPRFVFAPAPGTP